MKRFEQYRPFVDYVGPGSQQLDSPFRQPTPRSDWATPLLVSGTIAGLIAAICYAALVFSNEASKASFKVAVMAFLISWLVTFVVLMNRFHKSLYYTIHHEGITKAKRDERPIVYSRGGKSVSVLSRKEELEGAPAEEQCPYQPGTMRWFVWLLEEEGTGYNTWEHKKGVGRKKYLAWRNSLLDGGWADWNSYNEDGEPVTGLGWSLVADREDVIAAIKVR